MATTPQTEIADNLSCILKPSGIDRWHQTPINDLGGLTPAQSIAAGDAEAVVQLTRSYLDPSYA